MILRRKAKNTSESKCTSAGRVTANLLLSFLTLAPATAHAAANSPSYEQAVLPLKPDFFNPAPEPPPPAEHVFVSICLPSTNHSCPFVDVDHFAHHHSLYDTSSTTARTNTQLCTENRMSYTQTNRYGWLPRTNTPPSDCHP